MTDKHHSPEAWRLDNENATAILRAFSYGHGGYGGAGGPVSTAGGGAGYGGIRWPSQPKNNHAGDKTMTDETRAIYEIDRCTSVDELIRFQRGLNADGDMTPKIERLMAARLAYLDVFDEVRR